MKRWTVVAVLWSVALYADQGNVRMTVHNLAASGPGEIKSLSETEVCKFCHVPHNTVAPQPLWGHALSTTPSYLTASIQRGGAKAPAPQPDGSSRLCLSCHDGTVALGDIGAGSRQQVTMSGPQRIAAGRRGYLGTDLSGSHPISFAVQDIDEDIEGSDMGLKPIAAIQSDPDVRLDRNGKLQCTTCHDPHADRYYQPGRTARFSVKPTTSEICTVCHEPR